ncbi:MAG: purine-binding chemotaxis protein CheW [Desulfuromusa sp.]|nr:purine-binding chemotaxis protein CheW [Desulfuromusa sp.]
MTEITEIIPEEVPIDQDTMQGMYLTFDLAGEGYGLEIRYVTEIIGIQKVTNVPDMPDHVIGVLNLRGKVIPIIDVRLRFNLTFREYDERTCIIVVSVNEHPVGLVVDQVSEVVDIAQMNIEPPPATGKNRGSYIQGLGKIDENVKILLNVEVLVEDEDLTENQTELEAV